jgi:FkbM family methyltransferase
MIKRQIKQWVKKHFLRSYFLQKHLRFITHQEFSEADAIYIYFMFHANRGLMLDVGAHYGTSFKPYERLGWQVFAFEPDPNNSKHIGRLGKNTELLDLAISDKDDQTLTLYTSEESSGISSLRPFRDSHKPAVTVRTKTLRTFCAERHISEVDFLKIDTEGFDLFVLKGFPFDQLRPRIILCEFEDSKTLPLGYSYKDMGDYLAGFGYTMYLSEWYPIVRYGTTHNWRRIGLYPANLLEDPNGWGNFIAVRNDAVSAFDKVLKAYTDALLPANKK